MEQVDHLLDALALALLLADDARQVQHAGEDPGLAVQVAPDHQVLEHRQPLEQREILERAGDTEPGDLCGRIR